MPFGPLRRSYAIRLAPMMRSPPVKAYGVQRRLSQQCGTAPAPVCMLRRQVDSGLLHCDRRRGPIGAAPDDVLVAQHSPGARSLAVSWRAATEKPGRSCGSRGCAPRTEAGAPARMRDCTTSTSVSPAYARCHAHGPKAQSTGPSRTCERVVRRV